MRCEQNLSVGEPTRRTINVIKRDLGGTVCSASWIVSLVSTAGPQKRVSVHMGFGVSFRLCVAPQNAE